MKINYTTKDGRLSFEFEASTHKDAFKQIAKIQEVFEDVAEAVVDGDLIRSDDITFVVRKSEYEDDRGKTKEAEYYEKQVKTGKLIWYKKCFGVRDDGSDDLFPKKVPEGPQYSVGNNKWFKYNT